MCTFPARDGRKGRTRTSGRGESPRTASLLPPSLRRDRLLLRLMAILIDRAKKVIVQGITGREGQARTRLMRDYGTNVVGGVTPGKGGGEVLGVPVFNSCADAAAALGGVDVSVLFVPANAIKDAAVEAISAGVNLVVLVADRVPLWDAMEIAAAAKQRGARFVGPNTLGIASPGKAVVGMIG